MKTATKRPRSRALPLLPEVRNFRAENLEVRERSQTDELILRGRPIVYASEYEVRDGMGLFTEIVEPGAVADLLATADVRFLVNHTGIPLCRSTSGTLTLTDTPSALTFEGRLDARQQISNDLFIAVQRSDVSAMSCAFTVARDTWSPSMEHRTIHKFGSLIDISAVTYPCSPATSISVAQRMALEVPVESRARLRRVVANVAAGKPVTRDQLTMLRTLVADTGVVGSAEGRDVPRGHAKSTSAITPAMRLKLANRSRRISL